MVNDGNGLEPRVLELIQREIDGANAPAESAELAAFVERDPAARQAFAEFRGLARGLDGMADIAPPKELRRTVMTAIATRPQSARRTGGGFLERLWPGRVPALRYAWVLVGVAGLAVVLSQWQALNGFRVDGRAVSGTLAPVPGEPSTWTVEAQGASGTVRSIDDPAGIAIAFDITGEGTLSVVMTFDPTLARFAGEDGEAPAVGDGQVRIDLTPGSPRTARFERRGDAGTAVGVRLQRGGIAIQQWTVEIPGRQFSH